MSWWVFLFSLQVNGSVTAPFLLIQPGPCLWCCRLPLHRSVFIEASSAAALPPLLPPLSLLNAPPISGRSGPSKHVLLSHCPSVRLNTRLTVCLLARDTAGWFNVELQVVLAWFGFGPSPLPGLQAEGRLQFGRHPLVCPQFPLGLMSSGWLL